MDYKKQYLKYKKKYLAAKKLYGGSERSGDSAMTPPNAAKEDYNPDSDDSDESDASNNKSKSFVSMAPPSPEDPRSAPSFSSTGANNASVYTHLTTDKSRPNSEGLESEQEEDTSQSHQQ